MPTVLELKEQAALEAEAARTIKDKADSEGRGLTQDEALTFEQHLTKSEAVEQEAVRQDRLETIERRFNEPEERKNTPEIATTVIPEYAKPKVMHRNHALRAFKGPNADVNAFRTGKWIAATLMGNAASQQWCRDNSVEMRVQTEGINAAGGYIVPDMMERAIIDLRETYGMMRKECRIVTMSSDHALIPRRAGGVTAYFIGETDTITDSDKSWNHVELTAKKMGCLTRMSTDLTEDAIVNLADDLADEMAAAFAAKEDACGIDGDGTNTYGGMTGVRVKMIDGSHAGSYVEAAAAGDDWVEIDASDLTNIMAACPQYALANAKWYCSPTAKAGVFDRLALAAGGNTVRDIAAGAAAQYSGYPIVTGAAMPSDDAAAALNAKIMLWFGDMRKAVTIGDRRGITLKVSSDRYLEYDQIAVQATERFCSVVHDIGGATGVRGPIVGLLGNT